MVYKKRKVPTSEREGKTEKKREDKEKLPIHE